MTRKYLRVLYFTINVAGLITAASTVMLASEVATTVAAPNIVLRDDQIKFPGMQCPSLYDRSEEFKSSLKTWAMRFLSPNIKQEDADNITLEFTHVYVRKDLQSDKIIIAGQLNGIPFTYTLDQPQYLYLSYPYNSKDSERQRIAAPLRELHINKKRTLMSDAMIYCGKDGSNYWCETDIVIPPAALSSDPDRENHYLLSPSKITLELLPIGGNGQKQLSWCLTDENGVKYVLKWYPQIDNWSPEFIKKCPTYLYDVEFARYDSNTQTLAQSMPYSDRVVFGDGGELNAFTYHKEQSGPIVISRVAREPNKAKKTEAGGHVVEAAKAESEVEEALNVSAKTQKPIEAILNPLAHKESGRENATMSIAEWNQQSQQTRALSLALGGDHFKKLMVATKYTTATKRSLMEQADDLHLYTQQLAQLSDNIAITENTISILKQRIILERLFMAFLVAPNRHTYLYAQWFVKICDPRAISMFIKKYFDSDSPQQLTLNRVAMEKTASDVQTARDDKTLLEICCK